ncbi:hypothetical protein D3C84_861980 [compost metagenome]
MRLNRNGLRVGLDAGRDNQIPGDVRRIRHTGPATGTGSGRDRAIRGYPVDLRVVHRVTIATDHDMQHLHPQQHAFVFIHHRKLVGLAHFADLDQIARQRHVFFR